MNSPGPEIERALLCDDSSVPSLASFEAASPAMQSFGRLLVDAARHTVPVLLVGEGGTGKTTFARALHEMSLRAARPFVRVDCPAAIDDLAIQARAAHRGTLFLDEVAELSPAMQANALGLLQDSRPLSVRLVASTRHDLEAEMASERFRKDLFYRLDVLEIRIPPLRDRVQDILPIARAYVAAATHGTGRAPPEMPPALTTALVRYSWPGNVQELLSVLQRLLILSPRDHLDVAALPERIVGY